MGSNSMRRLMGRFFPIVMIAIWVQLFAPIGASWTMAAAMDPIGSAPICSGAASAQHDQTAPGGLPQSHPDCCSLCVIVHSGAAPLKSPAPTIVTVVRLPQQVAWLELSAVLLSGQRGSHAQARAPPFYS